MKEGIHPPWFPDATVHCACGKSWQTGSTIPEIRTDICSECHPFYTGEQRIVDTEGQVDRFMRRLEARDTIRTDVEAAAAEKTSPELLLSELDITTRNINLLKDNNIKIAGEFIAALEDGGDDNLLAIKGFGRKGLADVKRRLKERGYELPESG